MTEFKVGVDEITLECSLDGGTNWAEVLEAKNVVIPEDEAEWRDRPTLNVKDRRKRYGRGMNDASDTTINCLYTTEAFVAAKAMEALPDETPPMFRATFPINTATQTSGDVFQYGLGPMLGWLVALEINTHIPVLDKAGRTDGTWSCTDFEWDPENNQYICLEGEPLKQFRRNYSDLNPGPTGKGVAKY